MASRLVGDEPVPGVDVPATDRTVDGTEDRVRSRLPAAITVAAAIVVLARSSSNWSATADASRAAALVLVLSSLSLVVAAAAALIARTDRAHRTADAVLLVAAACVALIERRDALLSTSYRYPSDEGRLIQHGISAMASLHNPYPLRYPDVTRFAGNTPLFSGGAWDRFGYPPLAAELGAVAHHISPRLGTPGTIGALSLLATAIITFLVLPSGWRGLAVIVVLGLPTLTTYAVNGHPAMVALPLLCVACARWTQIGAGGRLGLLGSGQALCAGLAAAAQQLAWFPLVGLLLAIWIVRRAAPGGLAVVARFAGVALAAFVVVDLPFMVAGFRSWLAGLLSQVTDHAVASGQGLVALNVVLRGGGGNFGYYGYATALLFLAVVAVVVVGFRRVAAAVPVLFALVFLVTVRSQGEYLLLFTPVWLVWAAGSDQRAVAQARPVEPSRLATGRTGLLLAVAAFVPALLCVAAAVAVDPPLRLSVVGSQRAGGRIQQLRVTAVNTSDGGIRPHFYLDPASHLRSPWRIVSGPAVLRAGQRAVYVLRPGLLGPEVPNPRLRIWALSSGPDAISSAAVTPRG